MAEAASDRRTRPTDADVSAFLDAVPDERRRDDARAVLTPLAGYASVVVASADELDLVGEPGAAEETVVAGLLARGVTNDVIAKELGIATQTVRNYLSTVYDKLGVRSRGEAIVWARERGIV